MTAIANTQSLHDAVTARIIAELEQGRFPWVQPWASSSGGTPLGLPQNASTGRTYSGINILLLWSAAIEQGRPSQRWLTFKQALSIRACVTALFSGIASAWMSPSAQEMESLRPLYVAFGAALKRRAEESTRAPPAKKSRPPPRQAEHARKPMNTRAAGQSERR